MTVTKRDLQSIQREINALEKKMDRLIAAAVKSEKPRAAKKAPAKAVKTAPAKKAAAKKRAAKTTATDQVLGIIKRSKKGVGIKALMDKTGFNQKKVTNILQRMYKVGKIQRVGKGIYVGA